MASMLATRRAVSTMAAASKGQQRHSFARAAVGMWRKATHRVALPVVARDASSSAGGNNITGDVIETMKGKISAELEADSVDVFDANGDNQHVSIDVVAKAFEGKNAVQRQRMVYKAIWAELQEAVHAVDSMKTRTPEEAAAGIPGDN